MRSFIRYLQILMVMLVVMGWMVLPITVSALGPIAYEQPPGHFGAFLADGPTYTVADEFQFDETTRIGTITWWGGYGGAVPGSDNFKVVIFADSSGQPGEFLQSFPVGNTARRTATGDWIIPPMPDFSGDPEYQYSYNLPTPFVANAGNRYWLVIINATGFGDWYWEVSGSPSYPGVQRSFEYGAWASYHYNTAFRLSGKTISPGTP